MKKCLFMLSVIFSVILSNIIAMELPKDMWLEVAKYGVDESAKTEKEIFKDMDNFRQTSKNFKNVIDILVVKAATKKYKDPQSYTYIDFKNDLMSDILAKRTKKVVPLKNKKTNNETTKKADLVKYKNELLNQAIKAEAINWSKSRLKSDSYYYGNLNHRLYKAETIDIFEKLLKMGADPNGYPNGVTPIVELIALSKDKSADFLELLFKYGAKFDPDSTFNNPSSGTSIFKEIIRRVDITDKVKDPVGNIKTLIKHGYKATQKDLDFAKSTHKRIKYQADQFFKGAESQFRNKKEAESALETITSIIDILENYLDSKNLPIPTII